MARMLRSVSTGMRGRADAGNTTVMSDGQRQFDLAAVPQEDPAIAEMVATLDAQLTAFEQAYTEAVATLGQDAEVAAEPAAVAVETEPPPIVAEEPPAVSEPEPPPVVAVQVEEPTAPEPEPASGKRDILGRVIAPEKQTREQEAEKPSPTPDPDEELLASLDEETARAIRVMRRMSPVKRSVKELLEEFEKSKSSTDTATGNKKKSWWSRG